MKIEEIPKKTVKRFLKRRKAGKPEECWEWPGHKSCRGGYGRLSYLTLGKRKWVRAHRLALLIHLGEIPEGMGALHRCDNPPCTNPAHLYVGDEKDNSLDAVVRGRLCSKLTPPQVRSIRHGWEIGFTQVWLADYFGVSPRTIRDALARGRYWRHVA